MSYPLIEFNQTFFYSSRRNTAWEESNTTDTVNKMDKMNTMDTMDTMDEGIYAT